MEDEGQAQLLEVKTNLMTLDKKELIEIIESLASDYIWASDDYCIYRVLDSEIADEIEGRM